MLTLQNGVPRIVFRRREFLRLGAGLSAAGFTLPEFLLPQSAARQLGLGGGPAKSCILVYLLGGPPHQDMFDLKSAAPAEIRGPFQPITTNIPGTQICEHLPQLAAMADRYALVRSVSHDNNNHTPMIYYTLTGRETEIPGQDNDIRRPLRSDYPHTGSVLAMCMPNETTLPRFISLPELAVRSSTEGAFKRARTPLRGGAAGFLGPRYEPLLVNGEAGSREAIPALGLAPEVSLERFERRAALLSYLDRGAPRVTATNELGVLRETAVALTGAVNGSSAQTFSLESEPAKVRDRYGRHRFGRTMLLARRLAEAGVPMIAIHWNEMTVCDGWDTHSGNFAALQSELLPMLDQGLSALLEDLTGRGMIDQTLVACFGEFGRTPKINGGAGRDHWGSCSTTLLAGGGIRGGQVVGSSDKHAAYPADRPVDPIDIQATMYHCLGLDPHATKMYDALQRPLSISDGHVVRELL